MAGERKKPSPVLLALLAVLLVVLVWRYRDVLLGGAAEAEATQRAITIDAKVQALKGLPAIALERPGNGEDYSPRRNLFDFTVDPQLVALEKARREAQAKAEEERRKQQERQQAELLKHPPPPAPPQPPPTPPQPTPPTFSFSYIAYIGRMGRQAPLGVLVKRGPGAGGDPFPVEIGDTIENAFVVKKIDLDGIVVGYVDQRFGDRTETVRLIAAPVTAPEAKGRR